MAVHQPAGSSPVSSVFTRTGAVVAGNADYLAVSSGGLTGATAATRYVGGTTTSHPVAGTFAVGDFVISEDAHVWICTVAGTPGTWVDAGSADAPVQSVFARSGAVVAGNADYRAVAAAGLTGATAAGRLVGATATGAPASGTFAVGDFVVAEDGHIFVCTVAGTPGTWIDVGSVANLVTSVFGRAGAVAAAADDYLSLLFPGATDLQQFGPTASATYTKPGSGTMLVGIVVGPAGGGGGGITNAVSAYGGAGGGSGSAVVFWLPLAAIPGSVTVQVGAGGAGGLGSANTTGNNGANGNRATIFDTSNNTAVANAGGGGGGGGLVNSTAGAAASAASVATYAGYTLASALTGAGVGATSSITTNAGVGNAAAGGGGGAGITAGGTVAGNGGAGGTVSAAVGVLATPVGASVAGAMGGVGGGLFGFPATFIRLAGGGGDAITGAGTGGAGGFGMFGGGGGGGGSSVSGNGGPGGSGGDGRLILLVF